MPQDSPHGPSDTDPKCTRPTLRASPSEPVLTAGPPRAGTNHSQGPRLAGLPGVTPSGPVLPPPTPSGAMSRAGSRAPPALRLSPGGGAVSSPHRSRGSGSGARAGSDGGPGGQEGDSPSRCLPQRHRCPRHPLTSAGAQRSKHTDPNPACGDTAGSLRGPGPPVPGWAPRSLPSCSRGTCPSLHFSAALRSGRAHGPRAPESEWVLDADLPCWS